MMNIELLFIFIYSYFSFGLCNKICSREGSRLVRDYFTRALGPLYEKHHLAIPLECVFSPIRDLYYRQELNKVKISNDKWLCKFCNKSFLSEFYLDLHFTNRHNDTLLKSEHSVCLSDYCGIFRCDILKKKKRSLRSFNPLASGSKIRKGKIKRVINEQQLITLRSQCSSLINRCISENINYDLRVKLQHQMYAEVCSFLTPQKYFELPNYRKPLVNFTVLFCLVVFLGMCLVGIGVVTHSDWKLDENDDQPLEKRLSDDSISPTTPLLTSTSANGITSMKNSATSIRQRVRFKHSESECPHSHSHAHHHHQHM